MTDKWWLRARCLGVDQSIFFPGSDNRAGYHQARWYCQRCPVIKECLEDAMTGQIEFGMWGGTTAKQRRDITDRTKLISVSEIGHGDKQGTLTGYYRERNAKVEHCDECRDAYNKHQRAKRLRKVP